ASQVAATFGVRSIRLKRQRGFAVAVNTGIRASRGDFIEMLNDDTEVQPGWADTALPWFDDPAVGAVAPLVLAWPDGKFIDSAGFRAMYEPASRVLHHISASYGRVGRRLIERQSCNEERVFWRNLPPSVLWRALPKHAAVLLGKAWLRLDEGTILPWLFGRLR